MWVVEQIWNVAGYPRPERLKALFSLVVAEAAQTDPRSDPGGAKRSAAHQRTADRPAVKRQEVFAQAPSVRAHRADRLLKHHIPIKTANGNLELAKKQWPSVT